MADGGPTGGGCGESSYDVEVLEKNTSRAKNKCWARRPDEGGSSVWSHDPDRALVDW